METIYVPMDDFVGTCRDRMIRDAVYSYCKQTRYEARKAIRSITGANFETWVSDPFALEFAPVVDITIDIPAPRTDTAVQRFMPKDDRPSWHKL